MAIIAHSLGARRRRVRDLKAMRAVEFRYFEVLPGGLHHGDQNAVVKITLEIADREPQAAAEIAAPAQDMIDFVRGDEFSLERLLRTSVWTMGDRVNAALRRALRHVNPRT